MADWTYQTSNGLLNGTDGEITKYTGTDTELIIPDSVDGCSITSIGSSAFQECISLESVVISYSVTSIGDYAFAYCSSLTNIMIPSSVISIGTGAFLSCGSLESIEIPTGVTSIGFEMFMGCNHLKSITIPDSITSIDAFAFQNCTSLDSIEIPNSVTHIGDYAFSYCSSLKNITIPNGVTSSLESVFINCTNLESVILPNSLTSIGFEIFMGCSSLTSIIIPNSVEVIGPRAFCGCEKLENINIPDGVIEIYQGAFSGCSSLESIDIPDSVTSIGAEAFAYCSGLTSITIPNSVTSISEFAFSGCSSLESIDIPDSVISICTGAFSWCIKLTNIIIPNSVTSIGSSAFIGCSNLIEIEIPNSVISIGDYAFSSSGLKSITIHSSVIANYAFSSCENLKNIEISDSVTSIGDNAFENCTNLTDIIIPNSVTSIGNNAFLYCGSLTNVILGDSVTSIGVGAFCFCGSLKSITIPDSVTSINQSTFALCSSLTDITIPNSVTSIGDSAFYECSSLVTIYYLGNETDAEKLIIEENGNEYLKGATWVYGYVDGDWGWIYVEQENNTACIISYKGEETIVTVPTTIGEEEYNVIEIASNVFANTKITSITFSNLINNLDYQTFAGMSYLQEIIVNENNANYFTTDGILFNKEQTKLICCPQNIQIQEYVIPNTVTTIQVGAFHSNKNIESIIFPNELKQIEEYSFKDSQIKTLKDNTLYDYSFPSSLKSIGTEAFCNTQIAGLILKDDVEYGANVFQNNKLLYSVEFVSTEEQDCVLPKYMFADCQNLTDVHLSDNIRTIAENAFYNCPKLTAIDLHAITTIDRGAFSLPQEVIGEHWDFINLNAKVSIPLNAFFGRMTTINQVYFGGTEEDFTTYIMDTDIRAIKNIYYNGVITNEWKIQDNALIKCFKEDNALVIPEAVWGVSIIKIGSKCFRNNDVITKVQLSDGIITIEGGAFWGCSNLTNITLGNNLLRIENAAFALCKKLQSIVLPNTLEFVGEEVFVNCSELSKIEIGDNIDFIGERAFYNSKLHGTLDETTNEPTYTYSNMWKDGLFILEGNTVKYLVDINEQCIINNTEINLEKYNLQLIASGCMDINNDKHSFLGSITVIRLPFHVERINTNAINLTSIQTTN